ncbi:MAG: DUF475 domain-containing protein [Magnetococcales bacterium]|nr:DUF475 domain-containing protein [Magnetococcales bacterium]
MKDFRLSFAVLLLCLPLAAIWGGVSGFFVALVLAILEVSLSFDNAVVNAAVLQEMDPKWQRLFLTVGILIAVFGMRLVFPIAIVAAVTGMGWGEVTLLALKNPEEYSRHLLESHVQVAMFGGVFLLMVFLNFVVDSNKKLHWLPPLERRMSWLGRMDGASVLVALTAVAIIARSLVPEAEQGKALLAGMVGVILFLAVDGVDALFSGGGETGKLAVRSGLAGFLYLEVLDATFSFDGVIGAFAITDDIVIIMLGLAIGAMFVRSLTVYLVHKGTLRHFIFLEHGAHYAIGVLAVLMLASTGYHIPEVVTGCLGVAFIGLSVWSSVRYTRAHAG